MLLLEELSMKERSLVLLVESSMQGHLSVLLVESSMKALHSLLLKMGKHNYQCLQTQQPDPQIFSDY